MNILIILRFKEFVVIIIVIVLRKLICLIICRLKLDLVRNKNINMVI